MKWFWVAVVLSGTLFAMMAEGTVVSLERLIPREVRGWRGGGDRRYDRKTIFDYLDGGAEAYLHYDFRQLLARRFSTEKQPAITVDLFEMGSPAEAFGIFSFERMSGEVGIGQGSEYASGLLRFWKGHYFVAITAERETAVTKQAVIELGKAIADAIQANGTKPKIITLIPIKGLVPNSVRYFHQHSMLNYLHFVSEQNILRMDKHTQAVLARYQQAKGNSSLLLIAYPDVKKSSAARTSFLNTYLPKGKTTGIAQQSKGKWVAAQVEGALLIIVFDSPTKQWAEQIMMMVKQKQKGKKL